MSELKAVKAAQKALEPEDNTITMSTGVVLGGKQVAPLVLLKIMSSCPRPKVPVQFIESMGRDMENPDDPDYQDQLKAWRTESSTLILNALILLGTEVVSVPKKMDKYTDNGWLDECKALGIPIFPANDHWRYLTWVTMKAAVTADDLAAIQEVVGRLSGITTQKVEAAESFPGSGQEAG